MKFLFFLLCVSVCTCGLCQKPVDTTEIVDIGGIRQYLSIKGENTSKPILLFLHGGPGGSVMSYADKFSHKLQKHFIVVHWDQRETGETLKLNASPTPLTLRTFENDTYELIRQLLQKFNHQKIYLVGHSWGTVLGFYIAKNHPELLYAYIPVCPMINQFESERIILQLMKEKAKLAANDKALSELNKVNVPFKNGNDLYYHRKWLLDYNNTERTFPKSYVTNWASRWLQLFNEASRANLIESMPALDCPVYFFVGRKDYQTNSEITAAYHQVLAAPKKGIFWFDHSGHFIPSSEPYRMQDIIIEKILGETFFVPQNNMVQTAN